MNENTTVCKEMSQEDFLKMIENHPDLKEKLESIGVSQLKVGLEVKLNYYDLLTKQEAIDVKKLFPIMNKKYFVKFGKDKEHFSVCFTDEICDHCYKGLLKYRENI